MEALLAKELAALDIDTLGFLPLSECSVILPRLLFDGAQSAAQFLMPYYTVSYPERNVSLYAVSKDYHLFFRTLADRLTPILSAAFPDDTFAFFCDHSPIDEVSAAVKCGLGVKGKNGLLIHPRYGSYVFIGTMITTRKLTSPTTIKAPRTCLACGACERACGFLAGKESVCASELNQRKALTEEEVRSVRSKKIRWGCDVCQEVCPMNRNVPPTPIRFFYEDVIPVVTKETLDGMSKTALSERAYGWRGRKTITRNVSEEDVI